MAMKKYLMSIVIYGKSEKSKASFTRCYSSEQKRPYSRVLYLGTSLEIESVTLYSKI
jgi:hypothetical protein